MLRAIHLSRCHDEIGRLIGHFFRRRGARSAPLHQQPILASLISSGLQLPLSEAVSLAYARLPGVSSETGPSPIASTTFARADVADRNAQAVQLNAVDILDVTLFHAWAILRANTFQERRAPSLSPFAVLEGVSDSKPLARAGGGYIGEPLFFLEMLLYGLR